MRTKVKICGVTDPEDARSAAAAGADAIGMVCQAPAARRRIDEHQALQVARALPSFVMPVLVFADADADTVRSFCLKITAATLQFHGRESAEFCCSFGRPYLKAVFVQGPDDVSAAERAHPEAAALVLDGRRGGSGAGFDWAAVPAPGRRGKDIIIAGGLSPENVAGAIAATDPYGVDVSSGVCRAGDARRKDAQLVSDFVAAAERARA